MLDYLKEPLLCP